MMAAEELASGCLRCEGCGRELPAANAQLHAIRCPGVLASGCAVLYLDKREEPPIFREATVVAVDRTLTPPAYTVRIGESERETERSRLFVNRPADDQATVVQTTAA
jgi:hypothetical protein